MNKKLKLALQIIVVLAIFYFMFMQVYKNWSSLKDYEWHFNYLYLAASFIVLFAYYICVSFGWYFTILKMKVKVSFLKILKIRAISELSRYLPGMIWHIAGRAYFAKKIGISSIKTVTSYAIELIINIIAGFIIFLIALPFFLGSEQIVKILPFIIVVPLGLILVHPKILNRVLNLGLKILKKPKVKLEFKYKDILLLILLYFIFWIVVGFAFWLLINSIYPIGISKFIIITGAYAISWAIGLLILFVPGGIGVREGVLAALLSLYMPLPIAIIISLVSRIWSIAMEFMLVGAVLKVKT